MPEIAVVSWMAREYKQEKRRRRRNPRFSPVDPWAWRDSPRKSRVPKIREEHAQRARPHLERSAVSISSFKRDRLPRSSLFSLFEPYAVRSPARINRSKKVSLPVVCSTIFYLRIVFRSQREYLLMFRSSKRIGFLKVASFQTVLLRICLMKSYEIKIEIKRGRTKRTVNSSNFQFFSSSVFGNFSGQK